MSMLKKLKGYFVVDDEEFKEEMNKQSGGQKTEKTVPSSKENVTSKPTTSSTPTPRSTSTQGKASSKFTNILLGAMDANNLDGFDYLEFKQTLHNLSKMPMDEATRYKSAYAAAQPMGVTPAKLIETAQFYIDILKKEEAKFGTALANQRSKQIGDKEQQIQQMDKLVIEKTKQIERLKKEIEHHKKQSDTMKKSISDASVKVETTKNNFIASYNLLVGQIKRDMDNMKKYLK